MFKRLMTTALIMALLAGCGQQGDKKMPEDIAKEFLEAIYVSPNLEIAQSLAGDELAELLYHYRSMAMIQRHIIGLRLTTAEVFVRDVEVDFFRRSEKDTKVELHIRGDFEGDQRADDRFLTMTKIGDHWKVKDIKR